MGVFTAFLLTFNWR